MKNDEAITKFRWASNDWCCQTKEVNQIVNQIRAKSIDDLRGCFYHCTKCDQYSYYLVCYAEKDREDLVCGHCGATGIVRVLGDPQNELDCKGCRKKRRNEE